MWPSHWFFIDTVISYKAVHLGLEYLASRWSELIASDIRHQLRCSCGDNVGTSGADEDSGVQAEWAVCRGETGSDARPVINTRAFDCLHLTPGVWCPESKFILIKCWKVPILARKWPFVTIRTSSTRCHHSTILCLMQTKSGFSSIFGYCEWK